MPDIAADYEADDVMVLREPAQLRAIADELRGRIVALLRERAASTTELAAVLKLPKGTVGHHLKVLERAGLIRVVRTRQVRAMTERFYGRTARLFVLKSDEESAPQDLTGGVITAVMLRQAAEELLAARPASDTAGFLHSRLHPDDVRRLKRRIDRLMTDFRRLDRPDGELSCLVTAFFPTDQALPPRPGDA